MALPTGSGSEILKRGYIDGQAETEGTLITGVALHIYSIISIIINERANISDALFDLYVDPSAGGTDYFLLKNQALPSYTTFIFKDPFVLHGTDKLHIIGSSAGSTFGADIHISYVDADWS